MKSRSKKVLLAAILLGLVLSGVAPALAAGAAEKDHRVKFPFGHRSDVSFVNSPLKVKPGVEMKTHEPQDEQKPEPVILLVQWGNLDGYAAELASETTDYKGYVEAITGDTQLRIVRAYPNDFLEDSFIQRTGQKIEFSTKVHGHKDGLVLSVGNYQPGEKTRLRIALGGDINNNFYVELNDLIARGGYRFSLDVEGENRNQALEIKVLGR